MPKLKVEERAEQFETHLRRLVAGWNTYTDMEATVPGTDICWMTWFLREFEEVEKSLNRLGVLDADDA